MLTLAPFFFTLLLIPVFGILFILADHTKQKKVAFLTGWFFGLGFFLSSTYWIALSLLVDSTRFAWMIPFATLGLSSILSIYWGLVSLTYHLIKQRFRFSAISSRILLFAILFALWEVARSYLFTGFPWNAIGYSLSINQIFLQPASLIGIYGLNLLTVLFATLPALLAYQTKYRYALVGVSICLLLAICGWSHLRISDLPQNSKHLQARLVQGNVAKERNWNKKQAFTDYTSMTQMPSEQPLNLVIWPESSFPYYLDKDSEWIAKLASFLSPNTTLLTGAIRGEGSSRDNYKAWNSLAAITSQAQVQYYDKHHLVPFGEYVPFRSILPIRKVIPGKLDFTPAEGKKLLTLDDSSLNIGSLICYEAIFSRHAFFDQPIDLLVNITNDGWFAKSAGPYQHLHMARMRGVEQGVPIIRAANSGISAAYDRYGTLLTSIGLHEKGFQDIAIPIVQNEQTFYSRYGLFSFFSFALLLLGFAFILHKNEHF